MNPAITAALIAASNEEDVKAKIEDRLKKAGALSPTRAITLDLNAKEQELLDQALASGTVKRTADGRNYLNEMAVADRAEGQGFMVLLIILVAASVIASGVVLLARAGS